MFTFGRKTAPVFNTLNKQTFGNYLLMYNIPAEWSENERINAGI